MVGGSCWLWLELWISLIRTHSLTEGSSAVLAFIRSFVRSLFVVRSLLRSFGRCSFTASFVRCSFVVRSFTASVVHSFGGAVHCYRLLSAAIVCLSVCLSAEASLAHLLTCSLAHLLTCLIVHLLAHLLTCLLAATAGGGGWTALLLCRWRRLYVCAGRCGTTRSLAWRVSCVVFVFVFVFVGGFALGWVGLLAFRTHMPWTRLSKETPKQKRHQHLLSPRYTLARRWCNSSK